MSAVSPIGSLAHDPAPIIYPVIDPEEGIHFAVGLTA